ncbi:MAG: hypothetical protein OJF52_003171 [Nitrospira sp.]|nr:MAG: hypothetical protein OJF52_003171 [Nitrospira sp.]
MTEPLPALIVYATVDAAFSASVPEERTVVEQDCRRLTPDEIAARLAGLEWAVETARGGFESAWCHFVDSSNRRSRRTLYDPPSADR